MLTASPQWEPYKAQEDARATCNEYGIKVTLFHGREEVLDVVVDPSILPFSPNHRFSEWKRTPKRQEFQQNRTSSQAIPWVFAWTRIIFVLPAWLGVGAGLKGVHAGGDIPRFASNVQRMAILPNRL
ncbi:hypothetical protein IFM89_039294 [Coptis chinensis]|uniref:Uncharacterized protein n=1 Tax=Coptis chinensis TaxID=261450 RepID=A0A835LQQ9_9MAGN|nr:hypothetical protein IFM89_039294 [Coptis chinensis]